MNLFKNSSIVRILFLVIPFISLAQSQTPCEQQDNYFTQLENVNPQLSIDLLEGWNMIGFPCSVEQNVGTAFAEIQDHISLLKDNNGNIFLPEFSFNSIGVLKPLNGYQIKMTSPVTSFSFCESFIQPIIEGCTDCESLNFNPFATNNNGTCQYLGCMDPTAYNYNDIANIDDESCIPVVLGCLDTSACNYDTAANTSSEICIYTDGFCETCENGLIVDNDSDNDGLCDSEDILSGCIDEIACNYDSSSTINEDNTICIYVDGICETCDDGLVVDNDSDNDGLCDSEDILSGCIDEIACNYDSSTTLNEDNSLCIYVDGVCETCETGLVVDNDSDNDGLCDSEDILTGCIDETACNYDSSSTINEDNTICTYVDGICETCSGAQDGTGTIVNNDSDNDGLCDSEDNLAGCIDEIACNYDSSSTINEDNSLCIYVDGVCETCENGLVVDNDADNDGLCDSEDILSGCIDETACNYDSSSTINEDNTICTYTDGICETCENGLVVDNDTDNDGLCDSEDILSGCIDEIACNYESSSTLNEDNTICTYVDDICETCSGAQDGTGTIVNNDSDNDGLCDSEDILTGCIDETACNYDSSSTLNEDNSLCIYVDGICETCEDGLVIDNDTDNDGLCDSEDILSGCIDETACNYDSSSTLNEDNSLCTYATEGYDCEGNFSPEIGDLVEGGIVFYLDESGEHGLVAALEDITLGSNMGTYGIPEGFEWGCIGINVSGADGQAIGTGYQNTLDISAQNCQTEQGGITAAQATLNYAVEGFTDWYLPSFDELQEMYNTIGNGGSQGNIGGFETNDYPRYRSSSENVYNSAWSVYFNDGNPLNSYKGNSLRVRAVRAFGVGGCLDSTACNFMSVVDFDNGTCEYASTIYDCNDVCLNDTDTDGICDENEIVGCTSMFACNYNELATDSNESCTYPEESYDCAGNIQVLEIGALMHGGIVFYIDESGEHGLVAALEDITEGSNMGDWGTTEGFEWGCMGQISGADGTVIGAGSQNTLDIVAQNCETQNGGITAAQATLNYVSEGFTDWYLPSKYELQEMYNTIGNGGSQGNIGGFESDWHYYWSSSENGGPIAWVVYFDDGGTGNHHKSGSLRVRAVRDF